MCRVPWLSESCNWPFTQSAVDVNTKCNTSNSTEENNKDTLGDPLDAVYNPVPNFERHTDSLAKLK